MTTPQPRGDAEPVAEADLDEAWKSGFNAGFGEALRNSIRIVGDPDRLSDAPEDAHAVEAIREIEDWIASVKATLYPATEASHV